MPALVKSRFGASGKSDDEGTMVCFFSRKKSRNDCLIWAEVMTPEIKRDIPPDARTTAIPLRGVASPGVFLQKTGNKNWVVPVVSDECDQAGLAEKSFTKASGPRRGDVVKKVMAL